VATLTKISGVISRLFGTGSGTTSRTRAASTLPHEGDELLHFVVVFRPFDQAIVREDTYTDAAEAEEFFLATERDFRDQTDLQVVMFTARSLDSVKSTHPHYFGNGADSGTTAEFLVPRPGAC